MPGDCSESERRYLFNSAGLQRHPRVARAPPPSRADASGGGGARPSRLRDPRVHICSHVPADFQEQGRRIGGTRSMPAEVMVCYHFPDLYGLLAEKIRYTYVYVSLSVAYGLYVAWIPIALAAPTKEDGRGVPN